MLYLIDGYNFLFRLFHTEKKLENTRKILIEYFQKKPFLSKLNIHLIFDGYYTKEPYLNREYFENLKVIYTPKNQTADDYILEKISISKNPSQITIITSDKSLALKAKQQKVKIKTVEAFKIWLDNKEKKLQKKETNDFFIDTNKNLQRLLKIFEKRLKNSKEDWF